MEYNWLDAGVVVVLVLYVLMGITSGFVFSAFRIGALAAALILAASNFSLIYSRIEGTYADELVNSIVYGNFRADQNIMLSQRNLDIGGVSESIEARLRLPEKLDGIVLLEPDSLDSVPLTSLYEQTDIVKYFADRGTRAIISIVCIIALYAAVRVALSLVHIFLDEFAGMAVFKKFNAAFGALFGLLEGLTSVYIALAFIAAINIAMQLDVVNGLVDGSVLAKSLYHKNWFISFIADKLKF